MMHMISIIIATIIMMMMQKVGSSNSDLGIPWLSPQIDLDLVHDQMIVVWSYVIFVILLRPAPFSAKKFDTKNQAKSNIKY